jgi:hypothetical protein
LIVGYGTLLLRESAGRTIGEDRAAETDFLPVTVPGYRRLYNLAPPHYKPAFTLTDEPRELSAANIEPAEGAFFNGLAFAVSDEEISLLDRREGIYERKEVALLDFVSGEKLGTGFVYVAPPDCGLICRDTEELLPHFRDVVFARVGSYRISRSFGEAFDATSFLADGVTPLLSLYRDLLADPLHIPQKWRYPLSK